MARPTNDQVQRVVDRHVEDMLSELDRIGATPDQLEAMHETEVAEWFENWIMDSDDGLPEDGEHPEADPVPDEDGRQVDGEQQR